MSTAMSATTPRTVASNRSLSSPGRRRGPLEGARRTTSSIEAPAWPTAPRAHRADADSPMRPPFHVIGLDIESPRCCSGKNVANRLTCTTEEKRHIEQTNAQQRETRTLNIGNTKRRTCNIHTHQDTQTQTDTETDADTRWHTHTQNMFSNDGCGSAGKSNGGGARTTTNSKQTRQTTRQKHNDKSINTSCPKAAEVT